MKTDNKILGKLAFPPFYFFASIAIMIICYFILPAYNLNYFPLNLTGVILLIWGAYLIIKYTKVFHRVNTSLQNESPSSFVKIGFYRYSRNPMYFGGLLLLTGLAILLGNILSFALPFIFFIIMNFICIPVEEKIMSDAFMIEYFEYKKKVRRWL